MTAFVTGVPKPECLSLEVKFHRISIIHSRENLETLFPKTNDSGGGPQLVFEQAMTPGLYLFQVSTEYKLLNFSLSWLMHISGMWTKYGKHFKKNSFCKMTLIEMKWTSSRFTQL